MAYHTPPLKKAKKQGEMPLPSLGPIPLKNQYPFSEFLNSIFGMDINHYQCPQSDTRLLW